MIEYLYRYKELITTLGMERKLLEKLNGIAVQIQEKYQKSQDNIDHLNNEKKDLEDSITQIIHDKLDIVKRKTIFFSTILLTTFFGVISYASKFNIGIIFSTSIYSIIGCYFFNMYVYSLSERIYRRKNKKIIAIQELINEKNIELNKYKEENINLLERRRLAVINYNNQKYKVEQIENLINSIKIDYATPIFDREIIDINIKKKELIRARKINDKN